MKFKTTILGTGKTTAGIIVPPEIVEDLGAGRHPKVVVTMNGFTYRNSIANMSGDFMIGVSNEVRAQSGLKAGDEVDVELKVDTEPRVAEVPPALAEAFEKNPKAKAAFEALSYSKKRVHTLSVEGAKTDETRQRRVEKAIAELGG